MKHEVTDIQEEEAIKAVIENETNAYFAKNYDQRIKSFLQDENLMILVASKKRYIHDVGWDDISQGMKEDSEEDPVPKEKCQFTNYNIKVYKECAWAIFDEIVLNIETNEFLRKVINVRFLEKVNGKWKIVYLSDVDVTSYEENAS